MKNALFIAGTDTDVGKSVVSAALFRSLLQRGRRVRMFKPVQSGSGQGEMGEGNSDYQLYHRAVRDLEGIFEIPEPLYDFNTPCSPHLAAERESALIDYDRLIAGIEEFSRREEFLLIEGAGGLFTPLNRDYNYLDLLDQLKPTVLLVADNKLGMLNHTRLTMEALEGRGLSIAALVVNHCQSCGESLQREIGEDNIRYLSETYPDLPIFSLPFVPGIHRTESTEKESAWEKLSSCLEGVELSPAREEIPRKEREIDRDHIFHPYTSLKNPLKTYRVTGARGNYLHTEEGPLLDGMSSWWCMIHGYNNRALNRAVQRQVQQFSHVMFGGLRHDRAGELTEKLLALAPEPLESVFYCDSGSVSVEVALKLALQYWQARGRAGKSRILSFEGAYHGDTFGAMSVCDPQKGMHHLFSGFLPKQIFAPRPSAPFHEPFDPQSLEGVKALLEEHGDSLAALILEPIVQGAGGMWFYHPHYLRGIRELCDRYDVLLILDEIATGFGRTGKLFASDWASVCPDIMCVGKALTGGYLSFAATLMTGQVARGVSEGGHVFMHGPTYMANPLACAVACTSLDLLEKSDWKGKVKRIESVFKRELAVCLEREETVDVRVLGAIAVVELNQNLNGEALQAFFVEKGVWIRPFRNLIYLMPPFDITEKEASELCRVIHEAIRSKRYKVK
ncbi:MAG: adenosylmethionine--8-amino-7-oxononanoate transaminase [Spirochaetales bacterium]|nr:adenosylmethionine--8-amino-7-oxononanoate transaminase [Spirochaetales bacterium]